MKTRNVARTRMTVINLSNLSVSDKGTGSAKPVLFFATPTVVISGNCAMWVFPASTGCLETQQHPVEFLRDLGENKRVRWHVDKLNGTVGNFNRNHACFAGYPTVWPYITFCVGRKPSNAVNAGTSTNARNQAPSPSDAAYKYTF